MKYLFHNFINTLRHYKASSLLNIFGMAVAFAAFYVILTQVRWGMTYNQGLPDGDRIFVMTRPNPTQDGGRNLYFARPMAEEICTSISGVEAFGTATFATEVDKAFYYFKDGDNVRKFSTIEQKASPSVIDVFGFEAESGTFDDMSRTGAVAISSRLASTHGLKVGDYLSIFPSGEPSYFVIVAVWKDMFPENSSPGSIDLIYSLGEKYLNDWNESGFPYFVKLNSADGKDAFEQSANDMLRQLLKDSYSDMSAEEIEENMAKRLNVTLIPIEELYYCDDVNAKRPICRSGDKTTDESLLVVAILIMLIALINFVNFFFALVPARVKSVNTYKVFGTTRAQLILNFILESVGMVVLALMLGAVLVLAFGKTSATEILAAPIDPASCTPILVLTIAVAIAGAALSSIYPAFYITSFQPALVLKGSFGTSRSGRTLRNLLIGIQFTISLALIICAAFVKLQHNYMMQFDMGFDKEQLISGVIPGDVAWWNSKNSAFEDKLRSNPDIVDLTWANGQLVNQSRMGWGDTYKGQQINFDVYPVAYNFLDVMGIEIVEGRNFLKSDEQSETGVLIFNEEARDKYDITLDEKARDHKGSQSDVVGICKNFHFRPLQYGNDAFAFYLFGQDHSWRQQGLTHLYLRTAAGADPRKVMDFVRNTALELSPDVDPDQIALHPFDEELARKYKAEDKLSKQVTAFTLVAIILSLMGVFGLVLFETQHRRKEIAIRRVMGAEVNDVLQMFSRKYSVIVLICFVIAAPVSYLIIDHYFSTFAYHTPLSWWVFALALLIVLIVTLVIVVVRSFSAATSNPVESIKAE